MHSLVKTLKRIALPAWRFTKWSGTHLFRFTFATRNLKQQYSNIRDIKANTRPTHDSAREQLRPMSRIQVGVTWVLAPLSIIASVSFLLYSISLFIAAPTLYGLIYTMLVGVLACYFIVVGGIGMKIMLGKLKPDDPLLVPLNKAREVGVKLYKDNKDIDLMQIEQHLNQDEKEKSQQ